MQPSATSPYQHRSRLEWLFVFLVLMLTGGYLAYSLNEDRLRIDARERERRSHQCVVVSMNLSRQFSAINSALTG